MNKVKNILVLQSRIEILVTVPGLGHGVPVCGFHTRPLSRGRSHQKEKKNHGMFRGDIGHALEFFNHICVIL